MRSKKKIVLVHPEKKIHFDFKIFIILFRRRIFRFLILRLILDVHILFMVMFIIFTGQNHMKILVPINYLTRAMKARVMVYGI